jgi:YD repeat-containing protein
VEQETAQWTTYTFDQMDRKTQVNDPDLGLWTYNYEAASRLITQTDAKQQVTSLAYDTLGRVTTKTVTGSGSFPQVTANAYDQPRNLTDDDGTTLQLANLGKLTTATQVTKLAINTGVTTRTEIQTNNYDVMGHLYYQSFDGNTLWVSDTPGTPPNLSKALPSNILRSRYWADGSLRSRKTADGKWTGDYVYDLAGRLASIDNGFTTTTTPTEPNAYITSIAYNARGQSTSVAYGNGLTSINTYNPTRGFG